MKLFYLINGLGVGGAERSIAELMPHLEAAGIRTTVVCVRRRAVGVESDVMLAGDVIYLPGSGRLQWIRAFRRLVKQHRPDLIHTTLFDSHVIGRLGAAGTGVPVLSSLVSTPYAAAREGDRHLNALGFRLVRALDGWTARHLTTHFHAISHAVRDAYVDSIGIDAARVSVIERGRDPVRLGTASAERRRRVRAVLGLSPEQEVLINVGRQEYPKGQSVLLRAMARLAGQRPGAVLLIAGRDGHSTPELRRLHAELGLGDRVRFLGHRVDVPDLLAASDVFVFPSLLEGLGGAVIEAMALGLPVVASDIPALREVVLAGASGDLVPAGDPAALADALAALLSSPGRMADYGARGRQRFEERFGLERSAHRTIELYGRLTGMAPVAAEHEVAGHV